MTKKIDFSEWNWGDDEPNPNAFFAHGAQVMWDQVERDWNETANIACEEDLTASLYLLSGEVELEKKINLADELLELADLLLPKSPSSRQPWDNEVDQVRLLASNVRNLADRIDEHINEVVARGTRGKYSEELTLERLYNIDVEKLRKS